MKASNPKLASLIDLGLRAKVEERDQLAAENAALAAELAPLCAQVDALLDARAAYTDAPAHDVAVVTEVCLRGAPSEGCRESSIDPWISCLAVG
jgi:hypothetical protein